MLNSKPTCTRRPWGLLATVALAALLPSILSPPIADAQQCYEVRSYIIGEHDRTIVENYIERAMIPALNRQDFYQIGALTTHASDQTGTTRVVLVIPIDDLSRWKLIDDKLKSDDNYQTAAKEYLDRQHDEPAMVRIQSELLIAMDCMPEFEVDHESIDNSRRVYELRTYESPNERLAQAKIDMFNNGEVPIFHASRITPILIGRTLVGSQMPSLTYLTVYPSDRQRTRAWEQFLANPDWKELSAQPKYQNTVSRIDTYVLRPLLLSQM